MQSESSGFKAKAQSISLLFCESAPPQRLSGCVRSPCQELIPGSRARSRDPNTSPFPLTCTTIPLLFKRKLLHQALQVRLKIWGKQTVNCYGENTELDVKLLWTHYTFKNLFGCYH